jgi:hypothetical protein
MANGDLIKLGTFYLSGTKKKRPLKPWDPYYNPHFNGTGDTTVFSSGQTIEIRDTDSDDAYKIRWVEVERNNKKLLIADRNLLTQVSWNDLNAQELIFGKNITIDGQQYKLRVLTGGEERREGGSGSSYAGGKLPNEWDEIICNEANISGLPNPSSTDLDSDLYAIDRTGVHNQLWNWYYCFSLCQETYKYDSAYRAVRGYNSARCWVWHNATGHDRGIGWRPVLEVLNKAPLISVKMMDNIALSQGTVTLSGNAIDPDGDTMTISSTIASIKKQTTVAGTGSWSLSWPVADLPQGQYSNITITANDGNGGTATATYKGVIIIDKTKPTISISGVAEGQTYTSVAPTFSATDTGGSGLQSCTATLNGNAFTSGTRITVGGSYTLVVTAKDNAGNVSTQTINFKVNSAPTVEITTANNQTLYEGDSLIISGSANDADVGNALIVKLKFDEEPEKNILVTTSTGTPQPISYTVTFKKGRLYDSADNPVTPELNKDVVHSFTVYAKDDSGAESPRIVRQFMVVPNRNPIININPLEPLTSMVPTDTVTISGTVNDPDEGDTVTMEYKLNQGPFQPVTMQGETWSFSISVGDLRDGENIIELKAIDNKGGVTVKRMAIDQTPRIVPVKVSQSRYMILPPKGEMKGLVAWIQRKKGDLQVKGDLSIVATGQPESFVPMEKTSAELSHALDEDQFIGSVETAGQNVTIKLTETRTDALNSSAAITKIAGVIN